MLRKSGVFVIKQMNSFGVNVNCLKKKKTAEAIKMREHTINGSGSSTEWGPHWYCPLRN